VLFEAENNSLRNKVPTWLYKYLFQDLFLEGFSKGKMKPPLGMGNYAARKEKYYDFIGINYYTRNLIRFRWDPANLFGELITKDNVPVNDVGAEVYPEGLYQICSICYEKYKAPIFITENGVCDSDDKMRSKFIYDHLKQIARLIDEGIPIKRYYHWSLIDNFEWEYGESVRYGLVRNDFNVQERTVRTSGRFYGEICDKKAITQDMINRYLYD
jgi:beta-glucosidase